VVVLQRRRERQRLPLPSSMVGVVEKKNVATLTLGSQSKQGLTKV